MTGTLLDGKAGHPRAGQGDSRLAAPKMRLSNLLLRAHVKARPRKRLLLLSTGTGGACKLQHTALPIQVLTVPILLMGYGPGFSPLRVVVSSAGNLLCKSLKQTAGPYGQILTHFLHQRVRNSHAPAIKPLGAAREAAGASLGTCMCLPWGPGDASARRRRHRVNAVWFW